MSDGDRLKHAREAAAYKAWLDIFARFTDAQRQQIAMMFAHDWTISAVELQSYQLHMTKPERIVATISREELKRESS